MQILYSYFRYTSRFFLRYGLFVVVILSQLYEKPRMNKDWVTEENTKENLCEGHHHFFDCPHLLSMSFFVAFFVYYPSQVTYLLNRPNKDTYWVIWVCYRYMGILLFTMGNILDDVENMKISCDWILAG